MFCVVFNFIWWFENNTRIVREGGAYFEKNFKKFFGNWSSFRKKGCEISKHLTIFFIVVNDKKWLNLRKVHDSVFFNNFWYKILSLFLYFCYCYSIECDPHHFEFFSTKYRYNDSPYFYHIIALSFNYDFWKLLNGEWVIGFRIYF